MDKMSSVDNRPSQQTNFNGKLRVDDTQRLPPKSLEPPTVVDASTISERHALIYIKASSGESSYKPIGLEPDKPDKTILNAESLTKKDLKDFTR